MSLLNLTLSSALASDIGWTLVHFLWQGAVLALVLEAILPLCRSASARHNWALAALAAMVAAPVITFAVLHHASAVAVPVPTDTLPAMEMVRAAAPSAIPVPWTGWLVGLWLAGIALLSLRALGGLMLTQSLRRGSFALPDDLLRRCRVLQARLRVRATVRFAQTRAVTVPMVVGWLRPLILIPVAAIAGLPPQQLDALILHELAHISRLDAFTNLFLMLAETVLFYHPAIWWVSRRIRTLREHCCDDVAVAQSGDVTTYVEALTALEMGRALPAFALSARGGQLQARVARLLEVPQTRRNPVAATGLVLSGLIAAAIVLPALAQPKPVQPKQGTDTTITLTRDTDAQKPLFMDADRVWHRSAPGTSDPAASTDFSGHVRLKKGDLEIHADSGHVDGPAGKPTKITLDGNVVMSGTGKIVRADHAVLNLTEHNFSVKLSPIATELGANSEDSLKLAGPTSAFGVTTDQGTVLVQVDVQKLAANGLTLAALPGVITRHGRLRSIDDIAHIVVAYKDGSPVFVASVANLAYSAPDAPPPQKHAEAAHAPVQEAAADSAPAAAPAREAITDDQVKQRMAFFEAATNNFSPSDAQLASIRTQVRAELETERAQLEEAQRQYVTVSTAEVESRMKNVLAAQHMSEAQMQAALAKTGATLDAMREKLTAQLAWAKVVAADAAAQHPGQVVDPAEMTRIADEALARAKAQLAQAAKGVPVPSPANPAANLTLNQLKFEGNSTISNEDLTKEIRLAPGETFSRDKLPIYAELIYETYRRAGKYYARAVPQLVALPQNHADLIFTITEGPTIGVAHIAFLGNSAFSGPVLRAQITTQEGPGTSANDNYDPDRVEFDKVQLNRYYANHGYADAKASATAQLAPAGKNFNITYKIDEGPLYKFGQIRIDSQIPELPQAELKPQLAVSTGAIYAQGLVSKSLDNLSNAANKHGPVEVRLKLIRNRESATVDVSFEIVRKAPKAGTAQPATPPAPDSSHTDNRPARRDMASIPATANGGTNEQDRPVAQFPASAAKPPAQRVKLVDGQQEIEREQLQEAQRQHLIVSPPDVDRAILKTVPHPKVDGWIQPIARPSGFIPAAQTAAKIQPIMETHTLPPYPAKSAKLKEQGKVDLAVTIGTDGAVARARIGKSSGHPALDTAAAQYVKSHWRWQPPTRNGKPVAVTTDVAVVFKLNPPERAPQPTTP